MSVNTMNRAAIQRASTAQQAGAAGDEELAPGAPTVPPTTKVLADLSRYVPTKVLSVYVALLGAYGITERIADDRSLTLGLWSAILFGLLVTPGVVWVDWLIKQRRLPQAERSGLPLYNPIAAGVAFLAWSFALPASPFSDWSAYSAAWAGFAALVVSYGLGKADLLFGSPAANPEPAPS